MLVVASQTAIASKPAKGTFDHPAPRQDLKSFGVRRAADTFQFPAAVLFDPNNAILISAIRPNQFETTPTIVKTMLDPLKPFCDHKFAAVAIWNTRPMNQHQ